jgi:hypothetical protein
MGKAIDQTCRKMPQVLEMEGGRAARWRGTRRAVEGGAPRNSIARVISAGERSVGGDAAGHGGSGRSGMPQDAAGSGMAWSWALREGGSDMGGSFLIGRG